MRTLVTNPKVTLTMAFVGQNTETGRVVDETTADVRIGGWSEDQATLDGKPIKTLKLARAEYDEIRAGWIAEALRRSRETGKFVRFETVRNETFASGRLDIPGSDPVSVHADAANDELIAQLAEAGLTIDDKGNVVPIK